MERPLETAIETDGLLVCLFKGFGRLDEVTFAFCKLAGKIHNGLCNNYLLSLVQSIYFLVFFSFLHLQPYSVRKNSYTDVWYPLNTNHPFVVSINSFHIYYSSAERKPPREFNNTEETEEKVEHTGLVSYGAMLPNYS